MIKHKSDHGTLASKKGWICGILHLSSKVSFGVSNSGACIKRFTAFEKDQNGNKVFHVASKKGFSARDYYAVVQVTGNSSHGVPTASLEQYIGEVGDKKAEELYLKLACTATWANDKMFYIGEYCVDQYKSSRIDCTKGGIVSDIYSIDPEGCIDIDDAVCVTETKNGYEVSVHIADVSCYVKSGSVLDRELSHRCETVYQMGCQVNMLPGQLTKQCSLIRGQPKCVYSVIVGIGNDYKVNSVKFQHSLVVLKDNLSYERASGMVGDGQALNLMYRLGQKLYGASYESFCGGKAYDTHVMVEVYMVLANTLVAEKIVESDKKNALLRRHSGTRKEQYGCADFSLDTELVQRANMLLMDRAEYCIGFTDNSAHVGLGKAAYTHFTSPIRRYADIIVHRMLDLALGGVTYANVVDAKIVDNMNRVHSRYGKCERLSRQLQTIYGMQEMSKSTSFSTTGHIVSIQNTGVKVYLGEYDLTVDATVFSDKLADLATRTIVSDKLVLVSKVNGVEPKTIELRMFQEVDVMVAITITQRHKLLVQIVKPNIMSLFGSINSGGHLFIDDDSSD